MAKRKNHYYVLVMTNYGPVFVTSVDRTNRTAHWDATAAPLEFDKYWAEDLTMGLLCNGYTVFTVYSRIPQDTQAYIYDKGHFEWCMEDNDDDKKGN